MAEVAPSPRPRRSSGRGGRRDRDENRSEDRNDGSHEGRKRDRRPERQTYALPHDVAEELVALLLDVDGDADEDLLDLARARLDVPLEPRDAERSDVLFWLSDAEWEAVVAALEETPGSARLQRSAGRALSQRLAARTSRR